MSAAAGDPRATVVVVNWNGERWLRPCLDALARQTVTDAAVWVVDNASTDGSVGLLERDYPHVRVLRNAQNLGFAGGNDTALRQVTTPYAVLLNNDAIPAPDWLERVLAPFDEPGQERLAAVTSKVVFAPRFLPMSLSTSGFRLPGDPRDLGVRLSSVVVDGEDVTTRVLWERLTWAPEGEGAERSSWSRPEGELLVPVTSTPGPWEVVVRWSAERAKPATLGWDGGSTTVEVGTTWSRARVEVPAGTGTVDVVNNAGSVVLTSGYGADRGYQEVDAGQYDAAEEVFALCGCAVALRTTAGHEADWFDDDFFLYYEDTDLSWRLRAAGWTIRYEPTAVVRHVHSASSVEWSPTFVFHTDRNRLLMLVKDATAGLALREVGRYPLTTGSIALRTLRTAARARVRPGVR
ncbi:MAG: glycosyltransferase, partial [Actinomycetota bacterium]|nr:glycosyltransferase [Actinomycetota bacterium]